MRILCVLLGLVSGFCAGEEPSKFPPGAEADILRIEAKRTDATIIIDGKLDEAAWRNVAWSPPFVDLISGQPTRHATRVRLLWDADYLYVAYDVAEPNVQAKFTQRDSPIYQENDVELIVAGEDAFYEFEINALGTIYEGLFVWQSNYEFSGIAKLPQLDKTRPEVKWQPFTGVSFQSHPRGARWAFLAWDVPAAQTAVQVNGALHDDSDQDHGWTVELASPWKSFSVLNMSKPRSLPPQPGDVWRIDFSRFNQYKAPAPAKDSGGWALSHHGVGDSHIPECFPCVTFVAE
ncbi:carbohydrate-binding family 9-like protein [Planctomycetaceae bacterium SH139]